MTSPLDWIRDAAATRADAGLTRRLSTTKTGDGLDLAGNDYLGLRTHPAVIAGAVAAAETYGGGAGASRLVTGTLDVHDELEAALVALTGAPSALALSTGYAANLSVLTTLADAGTLVVSDEHAHASLIDGCRLSRAAVSVARHNDLEHVAELLSRREGPRAVVVVESIYSVLGDAAPVDDLVALTEEAGAILVVDEAHALGVVGPRGGGLVAAAGQAQAEHVVVTATLSKSLAAQGGAVLASPVVREHLVNTARPFIYDTGLAPASAGAALAALGVLRDHPEPHRPRARERRPAGRRLRGRRSRGRGDVGADAGAARSGRRRRAGAGARHPDRVLPTPVDTGRVVAVAAHRARRPHRARPRPGLRGACRAAPPPVADPRSLTSVVLVTGTGTEVGKTVVTAALAAVVRERGSDVAVVKPAQTGLAPGEPGDVDEVRRLVGDDVVTHELVRLRDPLSPEAAARREGVRLPPVAMHAKRIGEIAAASEVVFVEGAGGLLVRLDERGGTLADLGTGLRYKGVGCGVVLVASAGLGTLNTAALTAEALAARSLPLLGVVIGSWPQEPGLAEESNLLDLPRVTGAPLWGRIPAGAGALSREAFLEGVHNWFDLDDD